MTTEPDCYDQYVKALGLLCAGWARLDRELNALLGAVLQCSDAQIACIATEMNDVAPRCRLLKTLVYTVDVPKLWREDVADLCNIISNEIGPSRNRYIHDNFGFVDEALHKIDRRAKLLKPASFTDLTLDFDRAEAVDNEAVERTAVQAISASARLATARFDLEHQQREGHFPARPQLERARIMEIRQFRSPQAE